MFQKSCFTLALAVVLFAAATASHAQNNAGEILKKSPDELVAILNNPEADVFDKAKACQRLAVVGTKDAVPALAKLLADERLSLYARYGLEGIPDDEAAAALRSAAETLEGRQLIGVINSLGQLKDARAVDLLRGMLSHENPVVVSAAAGALGEIATPEAAGALQQALKNADTRKSVADGALVCADQLASAGKNDAALELYTALSSKELPKQVRIGALQGRLRVQRPPATDLLLEQIRSEDEEFFEIGLAAARELPGQEVTKALTEQLEKLPADRQARLLLALGDRQDPPPLATVLAATKSESPAVRDAAVRVLARSGDASAVSILLDAALSDGDVARSARERLESLPGKGVDQAVLQRLQSADSKAKVVLFELVAARRIADAEPAVRGSLSDSDDAVKSAAITALGQIVELDDLQLLLDRALNGSPVEVAAAQSALRTAVQRLGDRDGTAAQLARRIPDAAGENQAYLIELLGRVGGKTALETVVLHASSDQPAMKDAATRVLGGWATADAAPALLEIAQKDGDNKYRIRALRGYLRIARQLQLSDEARVEMFRTAMKAAQRDEERQLAMDVLTRAPSKTTLELAVSYLSDPALKNAAAEAAVKIAPKIARSEPAAVVEAMRKVDQVEVGGNAAARAKQLLQQAPADAK